MIILEIQICANRGNGGEELISGQHLGKDRKGTILVSKIFPLESNFFQFSFGEHMGKDTMNNSAVKKHNKTLDSNSFASISHFGSVFENKKTRLK